MRRLRNLRKEQKIKELKEKGLYEEPTPEKEIFIKRPFLTIPHLEVTNGSTTGLPIKIMTYNILAQALIRRKLFPTSGDALKWPVRSKALLEEFKYYNADILCLQEVDYIQFNSFWSKEFEKLGYNCKFYRANTKNHGIAIIYRSNLFVCKHQSFINYDKDSTSPEDPVQLPPPRTITQNVGLLAYLEFTQPVLDKYPKLKEKNGLIVGTTHMFWHPFGTFERTRQTFLILYKFKQFVKTLNLILGNSKGFYSFFSGDLNSQPYDSPYLSIAAKPVKYDERAKIVNACSLSYEYTRNKVSIQQETTEDSAKGADEEVPEEAEDIEIEETEAESIDKPQPLDPVPETFEATEDQMKLVQVLEDAHNSLDMRAISMYSVGYKLVDPNNAGFDNDRNEPIFSNWAHTWRGLLDYIFVITTWDKETEDLSANADSLQELEEKQGVRLLKLLKLPMPEDMGPEPSGQPRLNQFPSDHLCLMAEVELR
ncbi:RNA exonuclease NGL2 [Scheffersomyces xylosifermentans]|uniref:RNA exonuclease NGL2 n=1 Tax=Scheffersomyces xylosifermentans TaxID=1304137 RepID=UPI00315DDAA6